MNENEWMDAIDWHQKLEFLSAEAKKRGWCEQCQKPWNDGLCECGHGDDPEVKAALELAWSVELRLKRQVCP